jgi:ribosome maturation factor RimP
MKSPSAPDGTDGLVAEVEDLAGPLLESEGIVLVDVKCCKERNQKILRMIIDKDGGVTLDDCANVSRQLGDLLDAKLDIFGPYNVEISSPGLDCPLTKRKHFDYFKGRQVVIRTNGPVEGKLVLRGVLMGVCEDVVTLNMGGQSKGISFSEIRDARLDY